MMTSEARRIIRVKSVRTRPALPYASLVFKERLLINFFLNIDIFFELIFKENLAKSGKFRRKCDKRRN